MPSRSSIEIRDENNQIWIILPEDHKHYDIISDRAQGCLLMSALLTGIDIEDPNFIKSHELNLDICIDTMTEIVQNGMDTNPESLKRGEEEIVHATKAFVYATHLKRLVETANSDIHRGSDNGNTGTNKSKGRRTKKSSSE